MRLFVRFCLLIWMAVATGGGVAAKDVEIAYQAVMHVRASDSVSVLDSDDHRVGIAVFRGLAIFSPDVVAVHRYEGWFDLVGGSGSFHGYALFSFEDGSTLRSAYDGTAKNEPAGVRVSATFTAFSGTGRYEGVTGTGKFSGRRFDSIEHGGSTYLRGTLALKTPD